MNYIGISDFNKKEQVELMSNFFDKHNPPKSSYSLHIGVMTSYKILSNITTKWSKTYPKVKDIQNLFLPGKFNCLHYVDYDNKTSRSTIKELSSIGGKNLICLQLDMPWPSPSLLYPIEDEGLDVIIQVSKKALEEENNDPKRVVKRLAHYAEFSGTRVLIDKSMGRGIGLNAYELIPFLDAIHKQFPSLSLGVAGGLGPDSLHLIHPLVVEYKNLSIDAQGQLRVSGNALDPIDWGRAERYILSAIKLLVK